VLRLDVRMHCHVHLQGHLPLPALRALHGDVLLGAVLREEPALLLRHGPLLL